MVLDIIVGKSAVLISHKLSHGGVILSQGLRDVVANAGETTDNEVMAPSAATKDFLSEYLLNIFNIYL